MKIFTLVMIWLLVACQSTSPMKNTDEHRFQKNFLPPNFLPPNSAIKKLHRTQLVYDTQRGFYQSQLGILDIESFQANTLSLISERSTLHHMLWEAEQHYHVLESKYQELSSEYKEALPFGLDAHIKRLKNRQQLALRGRTDNQQADFDALAYLMILEASAEVYSDAIVFFLSE